MAAAVCVFSWVIRFCRGNRWVPWCTFCLLYWREDSHFHSYHQICEYSQQHMKTDKQKNIRLIYRREYLAIRPCIDLCTGCDELTLSCFLLSCQLSSQTTWTPPVTERGGNLWLHADRGHRNLLPSFLCTNPFKGEPLCDQTAGIAAELEASNTTALVLKLSQVHVKHCLPDLWHPQTACTFDFIRLTAFEQLRRK